MMENEDEVMEDMLNAEVCEEEQCLFCGNQAFVSLERPEWFEKDINEVFLVCDHCEKVFWGICGKLGLDEPKKRGGKNDMG